jgi:hypothetical protein
MALRNHAAIENYILRRANQSGCCVPPSRNWRIMLAMSKEAVLQEPAPLLATLRVDLKAVESGFPVSTLTKFLSASGM